MTLVILAAGMGSRYGGLKQIDPMTDSGDLIIDFSIYDALRAGFDKVVFIIKEENLELFRSTIGNRVEKHMKVAYAFQALSDLPDGYSVPEGRTKPFGTGHAMYCVRDAVKEPFAVINADDFYGRDTFLKLAAHLSKVNEGTDVSHYCMIGFRLGNTLTENGTVSRGACRVGADGMLDSIIERTKIKRVGQDAAYLSEDGETWIDMPADTIVSMNCWGFTPAVFEGLEKDLSAFLSTMPDPQKSEFYLPAAVDQQRRDGLCDVKVYPTSSTWMGVTYAEDKEKVKEAIRALIASGEYPETLWN